MLLTSAQWVMALALFSAFSRAGLNVIDRYQIGQKQLSILGVNLWNNVIPAVLMVGAVLFCGEWRALLPSLFDGKTVLFAALVQAVAYAFSHAFRCLHVNGVTVIGKLSDLLIPIGVFLTTHDWDWGTYGFAVATTLACAPLLWTARASGNFRPARVAGAAICGALVLQASLSPLLAPTVSATDTRHMLVFTTAVILWRTLWSLWPLLHHQTSARFLSSMPPLSALLIGRGLLTIVTQTTFIFAMGSSMPALAWPILNSTGFFAMLLSSLLLREKSSGPEKWVVTALTGLALIRFFA